MKHIFRYFNLLAGLVPLGIASVLSVFLLFGIQLFHKSTYYFLPDLDVKHIISAVIYFQMVVVAAVAVTMIKRTSLGLIVVFCIAILPRIILIALFNRQLMPFSDFLWSWDVAQGTRMGHSYTAHLPFPAYQVWACFEFLIMHIFANNYVTILITNAVFDSLVAVSITRATLLISNNTRSSICAGVLYALFPPAIIYCTISTQEITVILLNLVGIILLNKSHLIIKHDGIKQVKAKRYIITAGILFGISGSLKPFSIIIIVMFLIVESIQLISSKQCYSKLESFTIIISLIIPYFAIKRVILFGVSQWLGNDLAQYSSGVLYHQLLVGLNTQGEGQIHLGTLSGGFWNTFLENGYDLAAAEEHAKRLLIEDWDNHLTYVPIMIGKKIVWAWQDDLIPIHYFLNSMGVDGTIHHRVYQTIKCIVPTISQIMYASICILGAVAAIIDFKQNDENGGWVFIKLIIFGYFALLLIIEAQSRYKCLIIPLLCMMAARVIQYLWSTQPNSTETDAFAEFNAVRRLED